MAKIVEDTFSVGEERLKLIQMDEVDRAMMHAQLVLICDSVLKSAETRVPYEVADPTHFRKRCDAITASMRREFHLANETMGHAIQIAALLYHARHSAKADEKMQFITSSGSH